jgi:outer membrane immunogenic protein
MSNWLLGVEADIQGADIGRTSTVAFPGGGGLVPSVSTGRDHIDWFGTLRGRAGVTAGPALFYATGGLAYGGVRTSVTNVFTPVTSGNFAGSDSSTRVGWAAGAGVEWGFAPNWTVRGEYLHVDLGRSNVTMFDPVNFPTDSATYRFNHVVDAVRVGVNYRFGPTAVVAKY